MVPFMRTFSSALAALVLLATITSGEDKGQPDDGPQLNEQEQAFVELMKNSVLIGSFTIDGKADQNHQPEEYTIKGVTKVDGSNWVVAANIKYGKQNLTVPVPVTILWAGDTPMIQLTDLSIPGLGEGFSSRVLFYRGGYAGTWQHGKVGGAMFGRIEKQGAKSNGEPQPDQSPGKSN